MAKEECVLIKLVTNRIQFHTELKKAYAQENNYIKAGQEQTKVSALVELLEIIEQYKTVNLT